MPDTLCVIHGTAMRQFWRKDDPDHTGQSWYSHKLEDGSFCNGKPKTSQAKTIAQYENDKPDWDAINTRKEYNIARHVAYKAAIEMFIAGKITNDQIWRMVDDHTAKLTAEPEQPDMPF